MTTPSAIRLAFGLGCAFAALLPYFPPPSSPLWMLSIGVAEGGHVLVLLCLLAFLPGWSLTRGGRIGAALAVMAALASLVPLAKAYWIARALPAELDRAFGGPASPEAPLSLTRLFWTPAPRVRSSTIVYAKPDGEALAMDVFQPLDGAGPRPGVLVVHGGSWRRGDRTQPTPLNLKLAAAGYVVASIEYRLAPRWKYPAAQEDVHAALGYLKAHAPELGLDASRIALIGRSAGAQLAVLEAYSDHDPSIKGVVDFYGPMDLKRAWEKPSNPRVLNSQEALGDYLGGSPEQKPEVYRTASPSNLIGKDTPPTLMIHGLKDDLVFPLHSETMTRLLTEAGRPHYYLPLPWATHCSDFIYGGPTGQLSTYAVERFLAAVLR